MGKLLWEAINRSVTGPVMAEDKFETELLPTMLGEVQAKYRIEWDPDEPVMIDPSMADAVFQAGKELLLEVGLYCKNTKRIIKFTEQEINEAICSAAHEVTLGRDRQAITLRPRAPGDAQHPYCFFAAGGGSPTDIELYKYYARTVMQEATCDGVIPMPLYGVDELKNVAETPAQTLVCLTEARVMNEAAMWAGKPGLFFGIPMTSTTPLTLMSTFASGLYNKHNCTLPVQILQDMRVDFDRFNLAFFAEQHDLVPWISCCPALYGYVSGPEQGAIESIAHVLAMLAYAGGRGGTLTQAMSVSVHGPYVGNDITWCNSASALAAERNLKVPWISYGSSGIQEVLNDDNWYGTAIACINACISGMEGMWVVGGGCHTGIESRFAGELTRAAARLSPQEGREIIKKINKAKRDPALPNPPFGDLYDVATLRAKPLLMDQYQKFTRIFQELGFDYPTWEK